MFILVVELECLRKLAHQLPGGVYELGGRRRRGEEKRRRGEEEERRRGGEEERIFTCVKIGEISLLSPARKPHLGNGNVKKIQEMSGNVKGFHLKPDKVRKTRNPQENKEIARRRQDRVEGAATCP